MIASHRIRLLVTSLLTAVMLSACATNQPAQEVTAMQASPEELCTQVQQLIDQHAEGFSHVAGKGGTNKLMDIIQADYHLVGKGCQIWRWADGRQVYVCSEVHPGEEQATERYGKAVAFTRQCLGREWQAEKLVATGSGTVRTIFSQPDSATVTSIHRVKTEGVFKTLWTLYYFIGDREPSL